MSIRVCMIPEQKNAAQRAAAPPQRGLLPRLRGLLLSKEPRKAAVPLTAKTLHSCRLLFQKALSYREPTTIMVFVEGIDTWGRVYTSLHFVMCV